MPTTDVSFKNRFCLILWKNFCVERNRRHLAFTILSPALFFVALIILRFSISLKELPMQVYEPIDLQNSWKSLTNKFSQRRKNVLQKKPDFTYSTLVPRPAVAYAPDNRIFFHSIMTATSKYLNNINVIGYKTCKMLEKKMRTENYIAGACFDDSTAMRHLNYTLIFPSELRFYKERFIGATWKTNTLYDDDSIEMDRIEQPSDGGYVGYIREGFAPLQNAIALSYLRIGRPSIHDIPKIVMRRFPEREFSYDGMMDSAQISLPLILMASLAYPIVYLTRSIVKEKENNLKTLMGTMGVQNSTHFLTWFIHGICLILPSSLILLVVLKVQWNGTLSICSKSSILPLLLALISYNIVSVCFALMMSTFFTDPSTASIVTAIIWFMTYAPFIAVYNDTNANAVAKLVLNIFSNAAMAATFDLILAFEQYSNGLQWSSISNSNTIGTHLTIDKCILVFYALSVVYVSIGIIVEPLITKQRAAKVETMSQRTVSLMSARTEVFEVEAENKIPYVDIKGLTKTYRETVVKDFSLELYKDEITVLMGHNGSGKTLVMSMISGIIKPTSGTIRIGIYDTKTDKLNAFASMGVCIGDDLLFEDLTVFEQLMFFSRIKGMDEYASEIEVEKYISAMQMEDTRNILTKNLPVAARKSLSACCALVGGSKIVILDEPSTGMDLSARKLFWQMLKKEKRGRTIFISTHSTDEADLLADRAAMMAEGKLKCNGTTYFLKNIYSHGYNLICIKNQYCDERKVTEFLRDFIPTIKLDCINGNEIFYNLDNKYHEVFETLLSELDKNYVLLDLDGFSISEPGMTQIFLRMGTDFLSGRSERSKTFSDNLSGIHLTVSEIEQLDFLRNYKRLKGIRLWLSQCMALLVKCFLYDLRNRLLLLIQIICPILITTVTFIITMVTNVYNEPNVPITFSLWQYKNSRSLMDALPNPTDMESSIRDEYREIHFLMGSQYQMHEIKNTTLIEFVLNVQNNNRGFYYHHDFAGISLRDEAIVSWFNNFPLHTAPLSLNLVHNALARYLLDHTARITVTNQLLPSSIKQFGGSLSVAAENIGLFLCISCTFYVCFICSCSVVFIVKERMSRLKQIQFISGARLFTFWATEFIYHSLKVIAMSTLIVATGAIYFHQITKPLDLATITAYLIILSLFGVCMFPLVYLMSSLCKDPLTAYAVTTVYTFLGCSTAWPYHQILSSLPSGNSVFKGMMWCICRIFPHFSLIRTLYSLRHSIKYSEMCSDKTLYFMSTVVDGCETKPNCCKTLLSRIWCWDCVAITEIVYFLILGVVSGILMCIIENRTYRRSRILRRHIPDDNSISAREDHERRYDDYLPFKEADEVIKERIKVFTLHSAKYSEKTVICDNVSKTYGATTALSRFYLVLERSECFGLLGVSGSGMSTILKVLAGDEDMTFGRIFVKGISMKDDICKVYDKIGYSPQKAAFLPEYTGSEYMRMICLLRGIPPNVIDEMCANLAKLFGFYVHYHKRLNLFSSGNKRRLSCAVALLGNPSVIYLDEPTSGIDLTGKGKVWTAINRFKSQGKCVMLTSLDTRECEQMCSRVGMISSGRLMCIGTPQQLKDKYEHGYILQAKVKYARRTIGLSLSRYSRGSVSNFNSLISAQFPEATLQTRIGNYFTFIIPFGTATIAQIFQRIQRNSFILNIEHFTILRSPLSVIFMDLAQQERRYSRLSRASTAK